MKIDLKEACQLSNPYSCYEYQLLRHTISHAERLAATLHLLSVDGNALAKALSAMVIDTDQIAELFRAYREVEASAQDLSVAYRAGDRSGVEASLVDICVEIAATSCHLPSEASHIGETVVPKGSVLHLPTRKVSLRARRDTTIGHMVSSLWREPILEGDGEFGCQPHRFAAEGRVRVAAASKQPQGTPGSETYRTLDGGGLPSDVCAQRICEAIDAYRTYDPGLYDCFSRTMKLITACPLDDDGRHAGSISSLPGWAWQDVDTKADSMEEHCHLAVQLAHEHFHTRLNLIEECVDLYLTDGQSPNVFSPWKIRERPLRQVLHALFTFSAGVEVWCRLLDNHSVDVGLLAPKGESYAAENLKFGRAAAHDLRRSGALSPEGVTIVEATLENLESSAARIGP